MSNPTSAAILVAGMLVTGCSNSLWSKFQDQQCVENCRNPDPTTHRSFEQPVWQTLNMFLGEACCMLAYYLIQWISNSSTNRKEYTYTSVPRTSIDEPLREEGYNPQDNRDPEPTASMAEQLIQPAHLESRACPPASPLAVHGPVPAPIATVVEPERITNHHEPTVNQLIGLQKAVFVLPAMFDICGTTLMNSGLLFVPVSVFQMVRGALPLWVGLFSIIFLNRHLSREKWCSLAIITLGVALVGYAGSLQPSQILTEDQIIHTNATQDGAKVILGLFLIFFAQVFTASQFVIEEKIMTKYEVPPLEAVGLEGLFGLLATTIAIPILHILIGSKPENKGGYFDASTGLKQILNHQSILYSSIAIAISIAFFNFCGLAVTKSISATARSVIDTCRSIGIWAFSLAIGWEQFSSLQLIGFLILVAGTFLFNQIVSYPLWFKVLIGSVRLNLHLHEHRNE